MTASDVEESRDKTLREHETTVTVPNWVARKMRSWAKEQKTEADTVASESEWQQLIYQIEE